MSKLYDKEVERWEGKSREERIVSLHYTLRNIPNVRQYLEEYLDTEPMEVEGMFDAHTQKME